MAITFVLRRYFLSIFNIEFLNNFSVKQFFTGLLDGEVLCGIAAKQLRGRKPESVAVNSKGRIGALELNDFCIEDDGRTKKVSVEKVHTQFYKYMKSK